jgi:hypothetical protein
MPVISWVTWIIIALLASFAWLVGSRALRMAWVPAFMLALLVIVGVWGALYLFRAHASPSHVQVSITSPKSGDLVAEKGVQISGTIVPNNASVTVVVRSEKDMKWWIQEMAKVKISDGVVGQWQTTALLGTRSEGIGENFQIIALASSNNTLFNILTGRYITVGQTCDRIPRWEQSKPVVLRRTK